MVLKFLRDASISPSFFEISYDREPSIDLEGFVVNGQNTWNSEYTSFEEVHHFVQKMKYRFNLDVMLKKYITA